MSKGFFDFLKPQSNVAMADRGEKILYAFAKSYDKLNDIINNDTDKNFTKKDTPQWYQLLQDLGTSFSYLYLFHTHLIKNHPYFQKNPDDVKYVSFFMDMNASQLKNNFFKEEPGPHCQNTILTTKSLKDIYRLGVRVLDDLPKEEMQQRLYLFYHKIFVTYDYIYSSKDGNTGAFTQFTQSKSKYTAGIGAIEELANKKYGTTSEYRKNSMFIIQDVMRKQVGVEIPEDKYKDNFFTKYLNEYYGKEPLEPLSYILAHKLWKINKIIEHRFEQQDEKKFDADFIKKIQVYITEQVQISNKYYIDYDIGAFALKTYVSDLEFSKFIFSEIHHRNIDITLKQKSISDREISLHPVNKDMQIDAAAVKSALEKIHNNGSKFNKIFNDGTAKEIVDIIYTLEQLIDHDRKKDARLVGLYRSGALMAHCVNVINGLGKEVFLFTSFPYIGLHPMSCNMRDKYNSFIIVDESYKTGFTNLISMIYIARGKNRKSFQTVTLANFENYSKLNFRYRYFDYKIDSLATIDQRKNIELHAIPNDFSNKYDLQAYFKTIKATISNLMKDHKKFINFQQDIKNFAVIKKEHEEYYDVTRVLAHTNLLFMIAMYFWEKIKTENQKHYFLHAPSDEGRVIAEAIALVAKMVETDEFYFAFKVNTAESTAKKVFVDLTIDSGTNLKHSLKKDIKHEDIEDADLDFYDDVVVVLSKKDSNSKLKLKQDIISIDNY